LNRSHADYFSRHWVRLNSHGCWGRTLQGAPHPSLQGACPPGCADEYGVVATIFGLLTKSSCATARHLLQRDQCRTLTVWQNEHGWLVQELRKDPDFKMLYEDYYSRPWVFESIGTKSLDTLRRSPYLFARKFSAKAKTGNFSSVISIRSGVFPTLEDICPCIGAVPGNPCPP